MYDIGYDIVVNDGEFPDLGAALVTMATSFDTKLEAYSDCLERVTAAAVHEGRVADNLTTFTNTVKTLKSEATDLARTVETRLADFATAVDRADADVY